MKFFNADRLPKRIKDVYLRNARNMQDFYTFPITERQNILDCICETKDELSEL